MCLSVFHYNSVYFSVLHRILSDVLVQKIPEKTMTTAINFDKIFALANNAARVKILENFKLLWNRINVTFSVF